MTKLRSLCVFCGSRRGENPHFQEVAVQLADELAARGIRLIYGGGGIGLMGITAKRVMEQGGEVIGIIPKFLQVAEVRFDGVTETIVTQSMHERKQAMFDRSDAFLILPGGLGTLDESVEMMTWRQLHRHQKPIAILNLQNYWDPFLDLIEHATSEGFAGKDVQQNLIVEERAVSALEAIEAAL
jgi:uncharacterized protein (TIGR00730 family)